MSSANPDNETGKLADVVPLFGSGVTYLTWAYECACEFSEALEEHEHRPTNCARCGNRLETRKHRRY